MKFEEPADELAEERSHPSRVRGLKLDVGLGVAIDHESHPSRVRGLKYIVRGRERSGVAVAPLAGAWVEMRSPAALTP